MEAPSAGVRPFKKVVLVIGDTGAGKSKIINSLINQGTGKQALAAPALVGDATMGTTERLSYYYCHSIILTDTIGFFDRRIPTKKVNEEFINFMLSLNIGVNKFLFVLKHGKIKASDAQTFELLEFLFGSAVYSQATLIITHMDSRLCTLEEYRQLNCQDKDLLSFLDRFNGRVIIGSYFTHEMDIIDQQLNVALRQPFYKAIQSDLANCPNVSVHMRIINFQAFLGKLAFLIKGLFSAEGTERNKLASLFSCDRLQMYQEDTICLEPVLNDIYILSCGHVFHFDCLRLWMEKSSTCPNCRVPLKEFAHLKKEEAMDDSDEDKTKGK